MALELTSSQQSSHLSPSSKVKFKCEDGIIAFNNAVALLEHTNDLYHPMLGFLSNCYISTALTIQPSAIYIEYLKELWYITEEIVRAGLATLGLCDKDKQNLSSTVLVNSSPLKIKYFTPTWKIFMQYIVKCLGKMQRSHDQLNLNQQTIAYCLIWGLEIDIGAIIFSDLVNKLQNRKKNREENICYTRFLSLMFEKLLEENYINEPEPPLIISYEKLNADDTADKSSSMTSVQPVTQPKAPTDLKPKKQKIPPFSQPKSSYKVRVILSKTQVAENQHAKETVDTVDATKSLDTSESAEEQANQPKTTEAEKEEIKESGLESMKDVTFDQIMNEINQKNKVAENPESPFDTESEIKIIKRFQPSQPDDDAQITFMGAEPYNQTNLTDGDSDSGLRSMPDDDLVSLTGFETPDSADDDSKEGTGETFYASADMRAQSHPLGHLHEELRILNNKIDQLESSITKKANAEGEKWEKNNPETPTEENPDQPQGEQQSGVYTMANAQGDQPRAQELMNVEQAPHVNEESVLVLHASVKKSLEENTSEKIVSDDEPPVKKLKFLIPTPLIPSPTPLNSIMPEPTQKPDITKMTIEQFIEHISKTTSSIFSPSPPREPTPPRDESKGKGIATEEPLKDIMPFTEEGVQFQEEK
ncbi:hypothetical protein Tco_0246168 [Tanacetum coccineum]